MQNIYLYVCFMYMQILFDHWIFRIHVLCSRVYILFFVYILVIV